MVWRGDTWSRLLLLPEFGTPTPGLVAPEFAWTRETDTGEVNVDGAGTWAAVRSVDIGACSQSVPFGLGDPNRTGLAQQIDEAIVSALDATLDAEAPGACAVLTCGALSPEPIAYGICLLACLDASGSAERNRPSRFWVEYEAPDPTGTLPPQTDEAGRVSDGMLCYSADVHTSLGVCETSSVQIQFCFSLSVDSRWVPFLGSSAGTPSNPAPLVVQQGEILATLERLVVTTAGVSDCAAGSRDQVESALREQLDRELAQTFNDELWVDEGRVCGRASGIDRCRLRTGGNRVRQDPVTLTWEMHAEPDRIEVFPDRLEIVLAEDDEAIRSSDDPPLSPSSRSDRQAAVFSLGRACDAQRHGSSLARTDHAWGITEIARP